MKQSKTFAFYSISASQNFKHENGVCFPHLGKNVLLKHAAESLSLPQCFVTKVLRDSRVVFSRLRRPSCKADFPEMLENGTNFYQADGKIVAKTSLGRL